MKHLQEIKGYGFQQNSHNIPLNSIKQLEDKHIIEQSLIDKCVKSMIKERMSGCLINLERKRQQSQEKSISSSMIRQSKLSSIFNYLNSSTKKQRYEKQQSTSHIHSSVNDQSKLQNKFSSLRQSLYKISQIKKKDYQDNYLLRRAHKKEHTQIQNKKASDLSFISAIDNTTDENLRKKFPNKQKHSLNTSPDEKRASIKSIKLPKLKSKSIVGSPTTVVKSYSKKNTQYNINQDLWRFLTNQSQFQSKVRNRKLSNSTTDLNASASQVITAKEVKSSLFKPTIPSTTREMYISYINNLPLPFKRLLNLTLGFFQIKLPTQVSALYYSSMLQDLKKIHDRGWSFLAFMFWDIGRDGIITTNDIFNIFRQLNQFLDDKQAQINDGLQNMQTQKKLNRYAAKKQIQNEKKQVDEQISSLDNAGKILEALKKKDQTLLNRNNTMTTSISQLQAEISLARIVANQKQAIRNIDGVKKSVKILQDQVTFFNSQLSTSSYQNINVQELKQPQQSTISYLEQILLTNNQVKYKQIQPLFSAGGKQLKEEGENEHKIEIFRKEIDMKISSSYQQCFISTEHNEETRMLRERIENYKSDLKKFRQRRNDQLEKKSSDNIKMAKEINYIRFAQGEMWEKIKTIIFLLLGSDG